MNNIMNMMTCGMGIILVFFFQCVHNSLQYLLFSMEERLVFQTIWMLCKIMRMQCSQFCDFYVKDLKKMDFCKEK